MSHGFFVRDRRLPSGAHLRGVCGCRDAGDAVTKIRSMTSTTPDGQFFGPTIAGTGPDKDGGIMNAPDSDSTDNAEIIADESRA